MATPALRRRPFASCNARTHPAGSRRLGAPERRPRGESAPDRGVCASCAPRSPSASLVRECASGPTEATRHHARGEHRRDQRSLAARSAREDAALHVVPKRRSRPVDRPNQKISSCRASGRGIPRARRRRSISPRHGRGIPGPIEASWVRRSSAAARQALGPARPASPRTWFARSRSRPGRACPSADEADRSAETGLIVGSRGAAGASCRVRAPGGAAALPRW